MAEKIKPELLSFLTPDPRPLRILVVESGAYLEKCREMFPRAALYFVTAEDDAAGDARLAALSVHVVEQDYLAEPLPFGKGFFDYIIGDLTLEQAGNPQDIAAGFSYFLKETGAFLTSFRNIRHWSVLEELLDGHYYHVVARLFAKPEFEKLLYASYYKSVRVRPQRRAAPAGELEKLLAAGFKNLHDDLETEFWIVCAARSMPELALLKSLYSEKERAAFSRILHRVEYGVETEKQVVAFWEMYERLAMFPDYAASFIHEAVFHHARFFRHLLAHSGARRVAAKELLQAAIDAARGEDEEQSLTEVLEKC